MAEMTAESPASERSQIVRDMVRLIASTRDLHQVPLINLEEGWAPSNPRYWERLCADTIQAMDALSDLVGRWVDSEFRQSSIDFHANLGLILTGMLDRQEQTEEQDSHEATT